MESLAQSLEQGIAELLGRVDGPLHFRLLIMPIVVTILATRSGLRDAREGKSPFLWSLLTHSGHRKDRLRELLKDIGRVIIMALVVDTIYQLWQLPAYHPLQALTLAFVCAVVPYILVRGPVNRIARLFHYGRSTPADADAPSVP